MIMEKVGNTIKGFLFLRSIMILQRNCLILCMNQYCYRILIKNNWWTQDKRATMNQQQIYLKKLSPHYDTECCNLWFVKFLSDFELKLCCHLLAHPRKLHMLRGLRLHWSFKNICRCQVTNSDLPNYRRSPLCWDLYPWFS